MLKLKKKTKQPTQKCSEQNLHLLDTYKSSQHNTVPHSIVLLGLSFPFTGQILV